MKSNEVTVFNITAIFQGKGMNMDHICYNLRKLTINDKQPNVFMTTDWDEKSLLRIIQMYDPLQRLCDNSSYPHIN